MNQTKTRSNRGFSAMDQQRQREIASAGGIAAHIKGTAHQFTSEEAREAGRKGGLARAARRAAQTEGAPTQGVGAGAYAMAGGNGYGKGVGQP